MSKNSFPKLALCLSGQPRSYFDAYQYVKKNLLDCFDVDVFAHAWKSPNHLNQLKIYEEITAIYSPLFLLFDKPLSEDINQDMRVANASHPANFCTSMFYSIQKADHFRIVAETTFNKKYDFVIRSRFDLALNTVIDFTKLEKGKIYVSKDGDGPHPLLNDQFAIADPDTMNVYSSTYLFLRYHYDRGIPLCGHSMLESQMKLFNIPIERIDINHPFQDGLFNVGRHSLVRSDMNKWVDIKIWGY